MRSLRDELAGHVERLEVLLDRLPQPISRDLRERVAELRRLMLQQRAPRLALVGRRGSGKSSLINAIVGEPVADVGHEKATTGRPRWYPVRGALGGLDILDTRGLQEGSTPEQADEARDAIASVMSALDRTAPDAVLFVVKATEADAALDADVAGLVAVLDAVEARHGFRAPVVAVLTHADTVEPKNVRLHEAADEEPHDVDEKTARVASLERRVLERLRREPSVKDALVTAIAVSSYQSWRRDGARRADERWRIDELLGFLLDELPDEARVELVRLSRVRALQRRLADRLIGSVAAIASGVAAVPLPFADIGPLTVLQVQLVIGIAWIAGRELTPATAAELVGSLGVNVGAAFGLREVARGLAKVALPGAGSLLSAAIAGSATVAIGRAAVAYYIDGRSLADAARVFEAARSHDDPG